MAGDPNLLEQGLSSVSNIAKGLTGDQQKFGYSLEEIGKPFRFANSVDPQERTYRFLASRMNCVDIYPCTYAQSYLYNKEENKSFFKYGIGYDKAMTRYQKMCSDYLGDASAPSALRIFLTDDTTTTDGIQTQYTENFFQKLADGLSNALQGFTSIASSLSSSALNEGVDKLLGEDNINTDKIVGDVSNGLNLSDNNKDMLGHIVKDLKAGAKIILKGNKLSLPKIWQSSSYASSFSVSTKLYSPYGSPKAIKQYIVRPLVLIFLMGMPQSDDMVSYGRPFAVTVRSWGSQFLSLAGITNITLQRGGADSAFNLYKQPLVVNVNIEFTSIVDGVLAFADPINDLNPIPPYEQTAYGSIDQILSLNAASQNIDGSVLPTVVPTLGGIIKSFQPVQISDVTYGYGPQQSTRDDIMVGGNGGGGSGLGGSVGGILSPFEEAYTFATSSALSQGSFGGILGGIADTATGIARGVSTVTNAVNRTIGAASNLANVVSGGAFGKSEFGKSVKEFQSDLAQGAKVVTSVAGATATLANTVSTTVNTFGTLLKAPIK